MIKFELDRVHKNAITALVQLSDETILTSSSDQTIRRWTLGGRCLQVFIGHTATVYAMVELDHGRFVSCSNDRTIQVWSVVDDLSRENNVVENQLTRSDFTHLFQSRFAELIKLNHYQRHHHPQQQLHDRRQPQYRFVSGSSEEVVEFWNVDGDGALWSLSGSSKVIESGWAGVLRELPSGYVAMGSWDFNVYVWDVDRLQVVWCLRGHLNCVQEVVIVDQDTVATCSEDNTVRLWSLTTQNSKNKDTDHYDDNDGINDATCLWVSDEHQDSVESMTGFHHNEMLVSGSMDETIRIWDTTTGKCLSTLKASSCVIKVVELKDGSVVTGLLDGTIEMWRIDTKLVDICCLELMKKVNSLSQIDELGIPYELASVCRNNWNLLQR